MKLWISRDYVEYFLGNRWTILILEDIREGSTTDLYRHRPARKVLI
jgi:DNA-binding HxlR family transcriptional regulator